MNITKKFLLKKYIKDRLNAREISESLDCNRSVIYSFLKKYDIPRRSNSEAHIGQKVSEELKQKYSIMFSGSGNPNFRGGKIKLNCDYCNKIIYQEPNQIKRSKLHFCDTKCMGKYKSKFVIGENHPSFKSGKPKCQICGEICKYYGRIYCSILCNSIAKIGKNNPNWKNGISKYPYPFLFDKALKGSIKERDNFECQRCGITEKQHQNKYHQTLHVHHINYNKDDLSYINLITACLVCNIKANYNRDYWFAYYTYIMENYIKENKKWL